MRALFATGFGLLLSLCESAQNPSNALQQAKSALLRGAAEKIPHHVGYRGPAWIPFAKLSDDGALPPFTTLSYTDRSIGSMLQGESVAKNETRKPSLTAQGASVANNETRKPPLTEQGYQQVADLVDPIAMGRFIKRMMAKEGLRVKDQKFFKKALRFFDGECARHNYTILEEGLRAGAEPQRCQAAWLQRVPQHPAISTLQVKVEPSHTVSVSDLLEEAIFDAQHRLKTPVIADAAGNEAWFKAPDERSKLDAAVDSYLGLRRKRGVRSADKIGQDLEVDAVLEALGRLRRTARRGAAGTQDEASGGKSLDGRKKSEAVGTHVGSQAAGESLHGQKKAEAMGTQVEALAGSTLDSLMRFEAPGMQSDAPVADALVSQLGPEAMGTSVEESAEDELESWSLRKASKDSVDVVGAPKGKAMPTRKTKGRHPFDEFPDGDETFTGQNGVMHRATAAFVQGLVQELGGTIVDEKRFKRMIPEYSGTNTTLPYRDLMLELLTVSKRPQGWIQGITGTGFKRYMDEPRIGFPEDLGKFAPMSAFGFEAVRLVGSQQDMIKFVHRARKQERAMAHVVRGIVKELSGKILDQDRFLDFAAKCRITASDDRIDTITGGVLEAARAKNSWLMLPKSALKEKMAKVEKEKAKAGTLARTVHLSESGYRKVAETGDTSQMLVFTRRVMAEHHMVTLSHAGLEAFATYHSGECGMQSYAQLLSDLHTATKTTPYCGGGWVTLNDERPSNGAHLD